MFANVCVNFKCAFGYLIHFQSVRYVINLIHYRSVLFMTINILYNLIMLIKLKYICLFGITMKIFVSVEIIYSYWFFFFWILSLWINVILFHLLFIYYKLCISFWYSSQTNEINQLINQIINQTISRINSFHIDAI